jgi:hypothetical protein
VREVRKGKDTTRQACCPNCVAPGAGGARRGTGSTGFQELSALPPESGSRSGLLRCRTSATADISSLFDYLVGAAAELNRDCQTELFRCSHVDDQLDFRGLHDRKVGWLLALEYTAGMDAGLTV